MKVILQFNTWLKIVSIIIKLNVMSSKSKNAFRNLNKLKLKSIDDLSVTQVLLKCDSN